MGVDRVVLAADEGAAEVRHLPAVEPLLETGIKRGADVGLIPVEALIRGQLPVIGHAVPPGHGLEFELHHRPAGFRHGVVGVGESGAGGGLLVDHRRRGEGRRHAVPLPQQGIEDLQLDPPRRRDRDLPLAVLPFRVDVGLLLRQFREGGGEGRDLFGVSVRGGDPDPQKGRRQPVGFGELEGTHELPGLGGGKTAERGDVPAFHRSRVGVAASREFADLRHLFGDRRSLFQRHRVVLLAVRVLPPRIRGLDEGDFVAVFDLPAEEPDVGDLAHLPVVLDLEDDPRKALRCPALRGRKISRHEPEQFLHPGPEFRRPHEHGRHAAGGDGLPEHPFGFFMGKSFVREKEIRGFVVDLREGLRHGGIEFPAFEEGDGGRIEAQVFRAAEGEEDLIRHPPEVGRHAPGIRPRPVDLVQKDQPGEPGPVQRAEDVFGVGPDAFHRGDHQHGEIQGGEGTLHLPGEIHVPGRVDQVDRHPVPDPGGGGGADGDPPLPLHGEAVGGGSPLVHGSGTAHRSHEIEHLLRQGRLPRVHVGEDPDVLKRLRHKRILSGPF